MNMFLRMVFLLKVVVLLSLGSTAAWAECDEHEKHALNGHMAQGVLMLATSDQDQTQGDQDNDDSTIDEPTDDSMGDEGDSQT